MECIYIGGKYDVKSDVNKTHIYIHIKCYANPSDYICTGFATPSKRR